MNTLEKNACKKNMMKWMIELFNVIFRTIKMRDEIVL